MDVTAAARQIAAESARDDPLSEFDRMIIGAERVRIDLPLRDPAQVKAHLQLLIQTAESCILLIDRNIGRDRSILFDVRGRIRLISKKINHYRKIRSL